MYVCLAAGFLKVDIAERKPRFTNGDVRSQDVTDGYLEEAYVVNGVLDPRVGREVTLDKACSMGLIDRQRGIYVYPITNKEIPLDVAIERGLLRARTADPIMEAKNPNLLRVRVWKGRKHLEPRDFDRVIFDKIKERLPLESSGILEQDSGQGLTVREAFEGGVLGFNPLHIANRKGDKFALHKAASLDLVDPHTARQIFSALQPLSLSTLIEQGVLDPNTGEVIDGDSRMSLADAIDRGVLDADQIFYIECASRNILSLGAAVEGKKWDADTGLIIDPMTGRELTLAEAIEPGVIDPCIDADKLANQICALTSLKKHLQTKQRGVKHPMSGASVSIEDAILDGVLDMTSLEYVDVASPTEDRISLARAVEEGKVDRKTAAQLLEAASLLTLGAALDSKLIDPTSGKFIHPQTKRRMSLREAASSGFIQPSVVYLEDCAQGRVTSLQACIDDGRFDASLGKFRNPENGLVELSIAEAIKKGVIRATFDPSDALTENKTLSQMMKRGKVDADATMFLAPDGSLLPLKESLNDGLITPDSFVAVNAAQNAVSLTDPVALRVAEAIARTKTQLDGMDRVERALAEQAPPTADSDELQRHVEELEVSWLKSEACVLSAALIPSTCIVSFPGAAARFRSVERRSGASDRQR